MWGHHRWFTSRLETKVWVKQKGVRAQRKAVILSVLRPLKLTKPCYLMCRSLELRKELRLTSVSVFPSVAPMAANFHYLHCYRHQHLGSFQLCNATSGLAAETTIPHSTNGAAAVYWLQRKKEIWNVNSFLATQHPTAENTRGGCGRNSLVSGI